MDAVDRLRAGDPAAAVAAGLGVAVNTVYTWGKLARTKGKRALKSKPKSGRPLKLARVHWPTLKRRIVAGPRACGMDRDLWTLPLVRRFILERFGVDYHDAHLSRLLRRMGLSVQKPLVRARERDEAAIDRFVKREFPALRKKPTGWTRR